MTGTRLPIVSNLSSFSSLQTGGSVVSNPKNLIVEVLDSRAIAIADPHLDFKITYRREGNVLAATHMPSTPSRAEINFMVLAWKAAHAKALELGWLKRRKVAA
jgi:hypothetical protein